MDDALEMVDVIDAVRTMLTHIEDEIPAKYAGDFGVAYRALAHISDGMYRDATGDRTIEKVHGGE